MIVIYFSSEIDCEVTVLITPGYCVKNLLVIKIVLYQFVDSDEGPGPAHPSTAVDQDA